MNFDKHFIGSLEIFRISTLGRVVEGMKTNINCFQLHVQLMKSAAAFCEYLNCFVCSESHSDAKI